MDEAMDKWEKSLEERLGRNLRKKRVQAGWSLYQMSQITGVGRQTLLHYEWANRSPSIGKIMRICKTTGWKLSDLMGGGKSA